MTSESANVMSSSGAIILNDRGVLRIAGPEAREFLQGLITNDMKKVSPDKAIYAALLTPQGKFLFDFFIVAQGTGFLFDCDSDSLPALNKRLTMYKLRADVTLDDVSDDHAVIAIIGNAAAGSTKSGQKPRGSTWSEDGGMIYVDPRLDRLGLRAILPKTNIDSWIEQENLTVLASDAYETHRLALGVPKGGADIKSDKSFLLESNFDELHGVDHNKGCYIGQETTSRTKRKTELRKRLLPVDINGDLPPPGTAILAGEVEVGSLWSGHGHRAIGLIRIDRWQKAKEDGVALTSGGATATIDMPDWIEA